MPFSSSWEQSVGKGNLRVPEEEEGEEVKLAVRPRARRREALEAVTGGEVGGDGGSALGPEPHRVRGAGVEPGQVVLRQRRVQHHFLLRRKSPCCFLFSFNYIHTSVYLNKYIPVSHLHRMTFAPVGQAEAAGGAGGRFP